MTEVLAREIQAVKPTFADWAAKARLPYDEQQKQLLKKMYDFYGAHGAAGNSLTLQAILGREPRTLRQFIKELAER